MRHLAGWLLAGAVLLARPAHGQIRRAVEVGGGVIDVTIAGTPSVSEAALLRWVEAAARSVVDYLGRFPVPRVHLYVRAGREGGVGHGVTYGGRVPQIRISVGQQSTEEDLLEDWVLTHEMVHLSFPNLTSDDRWAEEGLATYVESVARVRSRARSEEEMWAGLMDGMPKGAPRSDDDMLHETRSWGRTYWGGALFWLLADVEIRERTGNRRGLEEALRGILAAGGDLRAAWSLSRTLETGDRAVGLDVLSKLYARLGESAETVDLPGLWRRLGLRRVRRGVVYDDRAPLAAVRQAITSAFRSPERSSASIRLRIGNGSGSTLFRRLHTTAIVPQAFVIAITSTRRWYRRPWLSPCVMRVFTSAPPHMHCATRSRPT